MKKVRLTPLGLRESSKYLELNGMRSDRFWASTRRRDIICLVVVLLSKKKLPKSKQKGKDKIDRF